MSKRTKWSAVARRGAAGLALLSLALFGPAPGLARAEPVADPVREIIQDTVATTADGEDFEVLSVRLEQGAKVPAGADLEVLRETTSRPVGRRRFIMLARTDNGVNRFTATATVAAYGPVYYLARPLMRGAAIRSRDLVERRMRVSRIPRGALRDPGAVEGLVTTRSIGVNTVLRRSYFKALPLARKGDRVMLLAENGAVRVLAPGVLREDASLGEVVRVRNLMSKKEVEGWLLDAGTVRMHF